MNIRGSIAIIVVAVVIIAALAYLIITQEPNGITAMEAVELANIPAKDWSGNCELTNVGITDSTFFTENRTYNQNGTNGLYKDWFCTYAVQSNGTTNASHIIFKVSSNGTVTEQIRVENSEIFELLGSEFIADWTIDSDEAYDIALNNSRVQNWLEQQPESHLLFFNINKLDNTMWHISWIDKSEPITSFLSVGIVADTGEILVIES